MARSRIIVAVEMQRYCIGLRVCARARVRACVRVGARTRGRVHARARA